MLECKCVKKKKKKRKISKIYQRGICFLTRYMQTKLSWRHTQRCAHTHTHTRGHTPPYTQSPTHTSATEELHKSFRDRHIYPRDLYLLSADAAIWTGKRKDRPYLFLLCDLQKQDVVLAVLQKKREENQTGECFKLLWKAKMPSSPLHLLLNWELMKWRQMLTHKTFH